MGKSLLNYVSLWSDTPQPLYRPAHVKPATATPAVIPVPATPVPAAPIADATPVAEAPPSEPEPAPPRPAEPASQAFEPVRATQAPLEKAPRPLYDTRAASAPGQAAFPMPAILGGSGPRPTLVTGATGFVGSAVARALLARGHTLRLLVRAQGDRRNIQGLPAELVEGDLTRPETLVAAVAGCRNVVHVAADYRLWVPDPRSMNAANVEGTRALMLAARDAGVERIVYCSSVAALGLVGDGTPGTEETPVHRDAIIGAYKQSKYAAEQEVRRLAADGVPVVIVNPTAPVGPRDIKPTPTGRMVLDAAGGRMPAYVETGLNVVHVDDVAAGHVLALERGRVGEAYILGGEDLGMAHLLALIDDVMGREGVHRSKLSTGMLQPVAVGAELKARLFGSQPRVTREMLAMADKQMFFSSAKAEAELGYHARPARQAIVDAVAWFRSTGALPPGAARG